jgi:hypothetical protein
MLAFAGMFALAAPAFAQSSGNVATDNLKTVCEVASKDGSLSCINPATGASAPCPTLSGGSVGSLGTPLMTTTIQTPSRNGTALVITPSLDTGLFTETKVSNTGTLTGTDTAESGILVQVTVDGNPVDPEVISTDTTDFPGGISGVMYDERFQQLSTSNLACVRSTTTCSITLILSSLSAHSFNFTAPNMTQGNHTVNVYAQLVNTQGSEIACVGPGSLTVVQAKAFQQNQ